MLWDCHGKKLSQELHQDYNKNYQTKIQRLSGKHQKLPKKWFNNYTE